MINRNPRIITLRIIRGGSMKYYTVIFLPVFFVVVLPKNKKNQANRNSCSGQCRADEFLMREGIQKLLFT
jgi:hypothetical protein